MDSLATDFPDLDEEGRQDLLLKTTYVLRIQRPGRPRP